MSDSPSVSPNSDTLESDKNIKGVFRTKTISIRRVKDPRSFKCSECDKRTNTLQELNAHYIANHRKVKCDICDRSFNMPGALRKHRYTHIEEKSQYRCRTCSKIFPFESQLKSHRHVHCHNRNYICASANCGKSFKHPGDLAAHAKSHGEQHKCAHCNYLHSDIRNLKLHLRTHLRNAPFTVWSQICPQQSAGATPTQVSKSFNENWLWSRVMWAKIKNICSCYVTRQNVPIALS